MTFDEAAARSIARNGARYGWPPGEIEDEIMRTLGMTPAQALAITCDELRAIQEQQVQAEHDTIATEFAVEED